MWQTPILFFCKARWAGEFDPAQISTMLTVASVPSVRHPTVSAILPPAVLSLGQVHHRRSKAAGRRCRIQVTWLNKSQHTRQLLPVTLPTGICRGPAAVKRAGGIPGYPSQACPLATVGLPLVRQAAGCAAHLGGHLQDNQIISQARVRSFKRCSALQIEVYDSGRVHACRSLSSLESRGLVDEDRNRPNSDPFYNSSEL